jgi:hypothetical protein
MSKKSLRDVLSDRSGGENFQKLWNSTEAAGELTPVPKGVYECRLVSGELRNSPTKGTPGYKILFEITEGDYSGRKVFHDLWLTPAAMPMAKRDLARLGITTPQQLEQAVPKGIRCTVAVIVRQDDDGAVYNAVKKFEVTGRDEPVADPFAPNDEV